MQLHTGLPTLRDGVCQAFRDIKLGEPETAAEELRPKEQGGRCCNEGDVVILVSFLCCYRCHSCVYQRCHCCHFLTRCLGISVSDIMVIYNFFPIIIIVFITMAITFMIDMIFLFYFVLHCYTSCSLSSIIHFYH